MTTRSFRTLAALAAAGTLFALPGAGAARSSSAGGAPEVYPVPPSGSYTIHGHGFGHGHGMSQWGAYGAAQVDGRTTQQILDFYYPHTTAGTVPTGTSIRVLLSAADSTQRRFLQVRPGTGLSVTYGGARHALPTATKGRSITAWRLQQQAGGLVLRERRAGTWHTVRSVGTIATVRDASGIVQVVQPNGAVGYRGRVSAELRSGAVETVNRLSLERYLRGVVPAEMPASWPAAALRAQAIAARTYAAHGLAHPKTGWYDVDGDTRDQAYGGVPAEVAAGTAAVKATAGQVLDDSSGQPVLAQFGAANGGWTVSGGVSYLPAQPDPYDGAIPNTAHSWRTSLSAGAIQSAFPPLGALREIVVTGRDGKGAWGGRITALKLVGDASTMRLTGSEFQLALGLRSTWWRPTPTPAAPRRLTATMSETTVTATWQPPTAVKGAAGVTGYDVTLLPGGRHLHVDASTRSASFDGVAPGSHQVSVQASSKAGDGPAATAEVSPA